MLTFESESDVIVYAVEKIIYFARHNQYLFVANCAWWIAGIIGLDSDLVIYIDKLELPRYIRQREVSTIPSDIARAVSIDLDSRKAEEELLLANNYGNQQSKRNNRMIKANSGNGVMKLSRKQRKKNIRTIKVNSGNRVKKLPRKQRKKMDKRGR